MPSQRMHRALDWPRHFGNGTLEPETRARVLHGEPGDADDLALAAVTAGHLDGAFRNAQQLGHDTDQLGVGGSVYGGNRKAHLEGVSVKAHHLRAAGPGLGVDQDLHAALKLSDRHQRNTRLSP